MNAFERFALSHYLSDFPDTWTYDQVTDFLIEHDESWQGDVTIWYPFEQTYRPRLVEWIDDLRQNLERQFTAKVQP